jgi:hypothetical protein
MPEPQQINYGIREFDLTEPRDLERVNVRAENIAVLRADDTAQIRINTQQAAPINPRELSGITVPSDDDSPGIERLYISNDPGTGLLRLLIGFGGTAGATETPSRDEVDVANREAREIGKARMQDSGGVLIDPATDGGDTPDKRDIVAWNAGTLPVDPGTVTVDSLTNTLSREITAWTAGAIARDMPAILTDQTTGTGSANAASLQLGADRTAFDVAYDLNGAATITIEVSSDGATWRTFKTVDDDGAATITEDTAFDHVRAYADANVNAIEMSAKGV